MAMVDDICDYLATLTDGVVTQTIFAHQKPPTPDAAISVHQFKLGGGLQVMNGAVVAEYVGLQIQVRDLTNLLAEATCYTIYDQLNGLVNITIGGNLYMGIIGRGVPTVLSIDQTRVTYYCEFAVTKTPLGPNTQH